MARYCSLAPFDYSSVTKSVANFLRGHAERIRRGYSASIIQTGKELIEAKHHLCHGLFIRWVQAEVGLPLRTAQAYMRVAQWAKNRNLTVTKLPPSVLYLISAPSAPEEFVEDVLEKLAAGEPIETSVIRKQFKALRSNRNVDRGQPTAAQLVPGVTTELIERSKAESASSEHVIRSGSGVGESLCKLDKPNPAAELGLVDAVVIMAHSMSPTDFARVRQILMSASVLNDPQLAQNIEAAFSDLEAANGNDNNAIESHREEVPRRSAVGSLVECLG